jgi:hypothetical protein
VWESDLDVRLSERAKHVLGFVGGVVLVIVVVLGLLAIGGLFGMSGQ